MLFIRNAKCNDNSFIKNNFWFRNINEYKIDLKI